MYREDRQGPVLDLDSPRKKVIGTHVKEIGISLKSKVQREDARGTQ